VLALRALSVLRSWGPRGTTTTSTPRAEIQVSSSCIIMAQILTDSLRPGSKNPARPGSMTVMAIYRQLNLNQSRCVIKLAGENLCELAAVVVGLIVAMLPAIGQEPVANVTEANKNVVRRAFQAFNQGDLKTLNEIFDAKAVLHSPQGKDKLRGGPLTELKDACPMCAALSDRKIKVDLILAEGDLAAVRSTWSGRYSGTVRTVAGKDVSVVYTNITVLRAGGKRGPGGRPFSC
jgi:ketosteroid isomerase-like protein